MKMITFRMVGTAFLNALLAVYLTGCCSKAYLPSQQAIGNLRVIGDQVKVNGHPAVDGQTIMRDDTVTTGAKSSATIKCYDCGKIQFYQSTD